MAEILVLGAGIVGTTSALILQARGHSVILVDRGQPGQETSFGNAGIIQSEAVEPYPMPLAPRALWDIATGRSNDVRWSPRSLLAQAGPLLRYVRHSLPAAHARAIATYRRLIPEACTAHAPLIADAGAEALIARDGYLELFRNAQSLDAGHAAALRFRADYGVGVQVLDSAGLRAAEPALRADLPGAIHWTDSWTVRDPAALTARYAALFLAQGGQIVQADAMGLQQAGAGWQLAGAGLQAQHVVIALGPWSGEVTARFGLRVPMVLKRGYHQHMRPAQMPRHTLADLDNGVVLSPMAAGLRIATGADLGADADPAPRQLQRGQAAAAQLLGSLDPAGPVWTGRRPCMPDMLPVVGAIPGRPGLWAHFGHGHHGLTLAAVTSGLLADALGGAGEWPALSPARLAA